MQGRNDGALLPGDLNFVSPHIQSNFRGFNVRTYKQALFAGLLAGLAVPAAYAQLEVGGNAMDNCTKIDALQKAGNLLEAREKANACLQAIEQALQGQVGQYFRTDVAGWKRTSFDQNTALGFANIEANYQKKDTEVSVSLTRGAGGGDAVTSGFGALLGGFSRACILNTGKSVKVGGLPATVQEDGTVMVALEDGSFLSFMSSSFSDANSALSGMGELINAFPVADINKTLHKK
jgi:hypothetical protein